MAGEVYVNVEDLLFDDRLQCRASERQEAIEDYREVLRESKVKWPFKDPIEIVDVAGRFHVVDGRHRAKACIAEKRQEVRAVIIVGSWEDAVKAAAKANSTHGMPRTAADKRFAVETVYRELGEETPAKQVAKMCMVTERFVYKIRDANKPKPEPTARAVKVGIQEVEVVVSDADGQEAAPCLISNATLQVGEIVQDTGPEEDCPACGSRGWHLEGGGYVCNQCGHHHGEPAAMDEAPTAREVSKKSKPPAVPKGCKAISSKQRDKMLAGFGQLVRGFQECGFWEKYDGLQAAMKSVSDFAHKVPTE